jgi:hypothetical protein
VLDAIGLGEYEDASRTCHPSLRGSHTEVIPSGGEEPFVGEAVVEVHMGIDKCRIRSFTIVSP